MSYIDGVENVIDRLDLFTDTDAIEKSLGTCCAVVERSAKQKAPKGEGALRRSITSKVEDLKGVVFTPLLYAPYVEYGTGLFAEKGGRTDVPWCYEDDKGEWHTTSGMHPRPFMRPALNESREQILRILEEGIGND